MARPVRDAYEARVAAGDLETDPVQQDAADALDEIARRLKSQARRWRLFSRPRAVKGLYIWGGVGRGKSMLMDLFHDRANVKAKRRVHFHAFMAEVHGDLAAWRAMDARERRGARQRVSGNGDDPIPPVAKKIADSARLLCFDEFQVTQIADAMILSRLFGELFDRGVTVVATSNRPPGDLYKNGINRELFTPFIDLLKARCDVLHLDADRDYRLEQLSQAPVWYAPTGPDADAAMDAAWKRLTLGAAERPCRLALKGRTLELPAEAAGVARIGFDALCDTPLGAQDYLTLASNIHTLMLDHVPILTPDRRNAAVRFTTLIDALYEARVKLVASAAGAPEELYPSGDGSFEFQRTVSRLHEMRSDAYLGAEHRMVESEP